MTTPISELDQVATTSVGSVATAADIDAMEVSAAAQEAMCFADDQFMEISTLGVSLYDPLLSDPCSSSSSGRLNHQSASPSSLRCVLPSGAAAATATAALAAKSRVRDESSLSGSGMSLASLGSLSRYARRPSGLGNVDEALDNSGAWREQGLKLGDGADASETGSAMGVGKGLPSDARMRRGGGRGEEAIAGSEGVVGGSQLGVADERLQGGTGAGAVAAGAGAAGERMTPLVGTRVSPPAAAAAAAAVAPGRFQGPSLTVVDLRHHVYHRRLASVPVRCRSSPPPPPVGVDLAPSEGHHHISEAAAVASAQRQPHPQNVPTESFLSPVPGAKAIGAGPWGVGRTSSAGAATQPGLLSRGDSLDESNGIGGHSSGGSNNGASSKVRQKGSKRAAVARALMRSIGISSRRAKAGSTENNNTAANKIHKNSALLHEGDGGTSVASWSADSSLKEGGGGSCANPESPSAMQLRALSESPSSQAVFAASEQEEAPARKGGLRGRLGQVWPSRRKMDRGGRSLGAAGGLATGSAVLQPASGGSGGFAFLPTGGGQLGLSPAPAPDVFPDWLRSRSAPVGTASPGDADASGNGGGGDISALFPTTPLGRSNRSFDPNQSPGTYTAEDAIVGLPPLLGSRAAADSLGGSFDPNRSTRSWFDMSAESQGRPPDALTDPSQQQQQHQQHQRHSRPPMRRRTYPDSYPIVERTSSAEAAAVLAVEAATAAADAAADSASMSTAPPTHEPGKTGAGSALAPVLFNEDQLVAELSDLSVSDGRRPRGRGLHAAPASGSAGAGEIGAMSAANSRSEAVAGVVAVAAIAGATDPTGAAPTAAPMGGVQESWEAVDVTWGGERNGPLLQPVESFVGVGGAGEPEPVEPEGLPWRTNGDVAEGATAPGARRPGPRQGSAAWPDMGLSSTEVVSGETAHDAVAATVGGAGGFVAGVGAADNDGLGLAPTLAPALPYPGPKAQSVDFDMLQQMAKGSQAPWSTTDPAALRWTGASLPLQGNRTASDTSRLSFGSAGLMEGLKAPVMPQRSVSVDNSSSGSRSSRNGGGVGGTGGTGGTSGEMWNRPELRWSGGGGGGGAGGPPFGGDAFDTGVASAGSAQPQLDGDDSVLASPLSGGGVGAGHDAVAPPAAQASAPRNSWSALHAMIPMPGAPSQGDRRASNNPAPGAPHQAGNTMPNEGVVGGGALGGGTAPGAIKVEGDGAGALTSFGLSGSGPLAGKDSLETQPKRRLTSSRAVDAFGKHKKQCLDAPSPPTPPPEPSAAGNQNAFEPFDFLRGRFGTSSSASTASTSAASTSAAVTSSSSTPMKKEVVVVSDAADAGKKTRQAVAARRPRDRGRFMKSQQKWVTQVEFKQTKATGTEAGGNG